MWLIKIFLELIIIELYVIYELCVKMFVVE